MTVPDPNQISRTVLLGLHDGTQPTIEAAYAAHAATGIVVVADDTTGSSIRGQAALLTAVATAVRAFGNVLVRIDTPDIVVLSGLHRGRPLIEVMVEEGVSLITNEEVVTADPSWPTLVIGGTTPVPPRPESAAPSLHAVWTGWTAAVMPACAEGVRTTDEGCVLAAITAAALGVSEAFSCVQAHAGSDAGYRTVRLNLWNPADPGDSGPRMSYAPMAWWLVGLGHLGQAYSWVLSWLDYQNPGLVQIVLQDTDRTTPANHSTGLLTPAGSDGTLKTRLVAAALDAVGFDSHIIERRLDDQFRVSEADVHVALLGVDNLPTRRLISGVGWRFAIDAGLGSGSSDYSSILLRRFPGNLASAAIPGWTESDSQPALIPDCPAFADLGRRGDACGLAELAGKAVGASFVGAIAACLAIAEALRGLHGGPGFDVTSINLTAADPRLAPAAAADDDVISLPLLSES